MIQLTSQQIALIIQFLTASQTISDLESYILDAYHVLTDTPFDNQRALFQIKKIDIKYTDITKERVLMPDIIFKNSADFTEHEQKATLQVQLSLLCKKELTENVMLHHFFKEICVLEKK